MCVCVSLFYVMADTFEQIITKESNVIKQNIILLPFTPFYYRSIGASSWKVSPPM